MTRFSIFMNSIKMLEYPELMQTWHHDCGVSAFQSALLYYGIETKEADLADELKATVEEGTNPREILNAAKRYGLTAIEREEMTIDDLKKNVDSGYPTIMLVQAWRDETPKSWLEEWDWGHYVVCIGYNDTKMIFEDPASPKRVWLSYDELESRWHSYGNDDQKVEHYGITVIGSKIKYQYKHTNMEHMD